MNTSISFYLNFMKFHISTPHNNVSENITRGRSPEKIVQMIIMMLIKRRKNLLFTLWKLNGFSFEQTLIPFTKGCFVPNLLEIGPAILKKIFKFRQCIFAIS